MTASPQTLETRVARLEELQSDMLACYRIRLSGCPTLEKRHLEIFNGDRKFWVLKDELLTLVLKDLEGPLQAVFPDTNKLASSATGSRGSSFDASTDSGAGRESFDAASWGSSKRSSVHRRQRYRVSFP